MSAAIITLLLAHLIADYPLQTDWLVKAKRTWPGLSLHASVHLVTVLVVCLPYTSMLWPYLLTLGVVHFGIDAFKNLLAVRRPQWIAGPYLFDQLLHLISIWLIAAWAVATLPNGWPIERPWQIYAIGFLFVTKVWQITERVLFHADAGYQRELMRMGTSRMTARVLLLALWLLMGRSLDTSRPLAGAAALWPYFMSSAYGRRALFTDLGVTLVVAALIWLLA